METSPSVDNNSSWLDHPVFSFFPKFKIEHFIIAILLILAIISRFYNVGQRDMSHDEVNHVVPSYELYQGQGYVHNPVTHGPLQFHLIAATYFMFGDSDFTSRIPSVVFSIATIAFILFAFKRYLGRIGALLAGLFYLISPILLFYGRYTRDEAFLGLFGVVIYYLVFKYLEKGKSSSLLWLAAMLSLQFTAEETAFIYTAILLLFLGILFLKDVSQKRWQNKGNKSLFSTSMSLLILLAGLAVVAATMEAKANSTTQPFTNTFLQGLLPVYHMVLLISLGLAAVSLIMTMVSLFIGLGWNAVKGIRSFDLLLVTFTLVLPLLTAFPIKFLGWDPLDYSQSGLIHTSIILVIMTLITIFIGLAWKPSIWLSSAGIFYAIFTVFYTTFFTNGQGFFTGIVGSLGYWLSQQSVNRGTQPWYYYILLQIPMYEYLAAIGLILAIVYAFRHRLFTTLPGISPALQPAIAGSPTAEQLPLPEMQPGEPVPQELLTEGETNLETGTEVIEPEPDLNKRIPVMALLAFCSIMSLIAYSLAGEKMPWLTYYIVMPALLAAGWGIGYLVETIPWKKLANRQGLFAGLLTPIFLVSFFMTIGSLLGTTRPFAGNNLDQLQATSTFLFSVLAFFLSGWGVIYFLREWKGKDLFRLILAAFLLILTVLTVRTSFQANYINFDNAKEFLVYAHGAAGPKQILSQVEEISTRTTGGKDIKVAYLGDALYPYWWYFRDYPNKTWIKDDLTRDLLNYPLVIADDTTMTKAQSILGDNYVQYDYKRLWWPMMDYTNLTLARIENVFTKPQMLEAIFNIWFSKDYTLYGQLTNNQNLTLETWQPSAGLHFFIKKDIVNEMWQYGTVPAAAVPAVTNPYANNIVNLTPDLFFGKEGTAQGQFTDAHGIAVAPDGSVYIADSGNNRIEHFSASGVFINAWGTAGSVDNGGNAPGGTFKEPWGIAVASDGSVYVADTWNYRIQKFTSDGKFVTMWGTSGQGETPAAFWGPRGVAVDQKGNVYVTDTGNKRVVVFDGIGNFITEFGSSGMDPSQFDEPVGIAVDKNGAVYVADTWNKRIQVFSPDATGTKFTFTRSWDVTAWDGQGNENKPFLSVDGAGNVFVTDPVGFRVLEFTGDGQIIRVWGQYSSGIDGFGNPVGIAVDDQDHVWVMDSANNYALRFSLSTLSSVSADEIPAIPTANVPLSYDKASNQLIDQAKIPYYVLDTTNKLWVPIVPASVSTTFNDQLLPSQDISGNWILKTKDGTAVYQWDAASLTWQLLAPINVTPTK
jgi:predicted membrane-bound mannosyltransferase/sugar lactone lactonase YvrE